MLLFMIVNFISATQDIVLDGWSLDLLTKYFILILYILNLFYFICFMNKEKMWLISQFVTMLALDRECL